jgi:3-methyladenine DNA glycosylase Tag
VRHFDEIIELAVQHHGGPDAFERTLAETRPLAPHDVATISDDRVLAATTRRVFCAGFSSKVIDAKWEAFESAFERFDPARCAWMTEKCFDELLKCKDIVRNGAKIQSVQENGRFVMERKRDVTAAGRYAAIACEPARLHFHGSRSSIFVLG